MEMFPNQRWDPIIPGLRWPYFRAPTNQPLGQRRWGFHTVRGGVDPGEHRVRSLGVGIVGIRRHLSSGHGILSSPGGAGSARPSQSAIGPWVRGFHTVRGGVDPRELDFRPRGVGVVDI